MMNTVFDEVKARVVELNVEEKWRLLEELIAALRQNESPKKRSIMEFEGLGAEMWRQIDVDRYLEEERNSWER